MRPARLARMATAHHRVTPGSARPIERLLLGATVHTLDPASTIAEAIAIRDGRIAAVGSAGELRHLADSSTEVLDLDGRTVVPGLIDAHMHSAMVVLDDFVDVGPIATPTADLVFQALAAAATTGEGWVLAKAFDPTITVGHPQLDRDVLDRLVPDRPAFVLESNAHIGYVNSVALRIAGVDDTTPDPPAARFVRDATGRLTGRVEESAAIAAFILHAPFPDATEMRARIRRLLDHAASVGATMLHDCGIGIGGPADLDLLASAIDENSPVRYRGMLTTDHLDAWERTGIVPGWGTDDFRVTGMKAWSDGSNQAGTGYQREPYLNSTSRGELNFTVEQLAATIDRCHRGGWQIGVHANGDAAIDTTIDAYEAALEATPREDHRHRIEHCSVLHPEQIERMARLGLSPSFLIGHIRWWGEAFRDRLLGPERSMHYDPCASALAAGLRISLHSDYNVTPLEPLRYVEDAVNRIMAANGEVLNDAERISVEAGLRAVTSDAAWQLREDHRAGTIEVGKSADLCVLDDDPFRVDATRISRIAVSATYRDGVLRDGVLRHGA